MLKRHWWKFAIVLVLGAYFSTTLMGYFQKIPVIGDWFKPKSSTNNTNPPPAV